MIERGKVNVGDALKIVGGDFGEPGDLVRVVEVTDFDVTCENEKGERAGFTFDRGSQNLEPA